MPASEQEDLVGRYLQLGLGTPFVWEPETFRRGTSTREPADLVWSGYDLTWVLNLRHSRRDHERQVLHNLRQLRGFLRAWSDGERLRGTSTAQDYDLSLEDAGAIVLVSVTGGNTDSRASILEIPNPRNQAEAQVEAVVTIPDLVLNYIMWANGSAVDLAWFINQLRTSSPLTNEQCGALIDDHRRLSVDRAVERMGGNRDIELDNRFRRTVVRALREMRPPTSEGAAKLTRGALDNASVLNDMSWEDSAVLVFSLVDQIEAIRSAGPGEFGPGIVVGSLSVQSANLVLLTCRGHLFEGALDMLDSRLDAVEAGGGAVVGILLVVDGWDEDEHLSVSLLTKGIRSSSAAWSTLRAGSSESGPGC